MTKSWSFESQNTFENVACKMAAVLSRPQCIYAQKQKKKPLGTDGHLAVRGADKIDVHGC